MGKIMKKKKKEKTLQIRVTKEFMDDLTVLTRLFKTSKSQYIIEIVESAMKRQKELLKNVLTDKK
jgi:predicted DNA-binding protein